MGSRLLPRQAARRPPGPRPSTLADVVLGSVAAHALLAPAESLPQGPPREKPRVTFNSTKDYHAYFEPLVLGEVRADMSSAAERAVRKAVHEMALGSWAAVNAFPQDPRRADILRLTVKGTKVLPKYGYVAEIDFQDPQAFAEGDTLVVWHVSDESSKPVDNRFPTGAVLCVVDRNRPNLRLRMRAPPGLVKQSSTALHADAPDPAIDLTAPEDPAGDVEAGEVPDEVIEISDGDVEPGEIGPVEDEEWIVVRLGSLTTFQREHAALHLAAKSHLLPMLLRPSAPITIKVPSRNAHPVTIDRFVNVITKAKELNSSQRDAVLTAAHMTAGFHLIQGPPGTGKTKTLMALLNVVHATQYQAYYESFLSHIENEIAGPHAASTGAHDNEAALNSRLTQTLEYVPARPRLLVCAPSNAAVDETLRRLVTNRFVDGNSSKYTPEIARIGAGDRVADISKPFTAEAQADKFIASLMAKDNSTSPIALRQKWQEDWQKSTNHRLAELNSLVPNNQNKGRIVHLNEKLERLAREMKRFEIVCNDRIRHDEKVRRIARTYIQDAQIVFATLSGAASVVLPVTASGPGLDALVFETTVIDEAAQATEPASLIPLGLGTHKCLLVGDPQQLPATVFSTGQSGLAYGQSLLERMSIAGKSVYLLGSQYRMNPAISRFPNSQFYDGKIVDDVAVQGVNRFKPYHVDDSFPRFGPYCFIDVECGSEERSRDDPSVNNPTEAILAVHLYLSIRQRYPTDAMFSKDHPSLGFGVITPYKKQMHHIRSLFRQAGVLQADVEVDTVDAFQGREKDVIVFSCVRTDRDNGIGFIKDIRRMNVGLTRAKYSCIVLGNSRALRSDPIWHELIADAETRRCFIKLSNLTDWITPGDPAWELLPPALKPQKVKESAAHQPVASNGVTKKKKKKRKGMGRSWKAYNGIDGPHPPPYDERGMEPYQPGHRMAWPHQGPPMALNTAPLEMNNPPAFYMDHAVQPPHVAPTGPGWPPVLSLHQGHPQIALHAPQYPQQFYYSNQQGPPPLSSAFQPSSEMHGQMSAMPGHLQAPSNVQLVHHANALAASTGVPLSSLLAGWMPPMPPSS